MKKQFLFAPLLVGPAGIKFTQREDEMTKKKVKKRNIVALQMQFRHKNGGSAGFHSKKGYSRKQKHKKTLLTFS